MHARKEFVLVLFLMFTVTESSGERTKTLRNLENEVQKSRQIDLCGVPPKIDCRPREAYVKIVADNNKHKLFSNLVLVKRCSGYCDSKVCKPTKKENVTVRVISSKGECQQHSVEEHLECKCFREVKCQNKSNCGCEGKKNSDCTSLKKWNNRICRCICKNRKSICSTGSKWDEKECRCSKNLKLK